MNRSRILLLATAGTLLATAAPALAQSTGQETHVLVRVRAHDAKLIGDEVGGARVTITDAGTGEVLATGVTTGKTGDTHLIIQAPHARHADFLDTPGAAGYRASFRLTHPTLVEISAVGPLDYPQATVRASRTLLLEPGADIGGDGIVLDLQGLIVEVLDATPAPGNEGVTVRARVRMLCSCPTGPDALWTVERVTARLMDGDSVLAEAPLHYAGQKSLYSGIVPSVRPGAFTLSVLAADTDGVNYGTATRPVAMR